MLQDYFSPFNVSYVCFLMPSPSSFFKLSVDELYIETQHRQFSGPDNITVSVWEESSFSTPVGFLRPRNPFSCSKAVVTVSIFKHFICLQSSRCPCVVVVFIYCGEGIMDAFDEALLAHRDKTHPEITKHLLSGKFL